jgi:hypothetical protein
VSRNLGGEDATGKPSCVSIGLSCWSGQRALPKSTAAYSGTCTRGIPAQRCSPHRWLRKGDIDFWGLSEVEGASDVAIFEAALEAANPGVDYIAKLSEEGGSDSLAIIYRSDRLTLVPYAGDATIDDNCFEVDSIIVGGTIRPALGVDLEGASGQRVVVLVNHWKCCGGSSNEQRRMLQTSKKGT